MAKYESSVKHIGYPVSKVYAKLSDLNNLAALKSKLDDSRMTELMKDKLSEEILKSLIIPLPMPIEQIPMQARDILVQVLI